MEESDYLRTRNAMYRAHNAIVRKINREYDEILTTIEKTGRGNLSQAISSRGIALEAAWAKLDHALNDLRAKYLTAVREKGIANA